MNIQDWTIQSAIQERVRQEDLYEWSQRPNAIIPPQKPLPKLEWHEAAWYVFGRGVYYVNCLRKI